MKILIPAAMLAMSAMPAAAFDRMNRTSCQESYQRVADMVAPNDANVGLQVNFMRVSPDSWCQFRGSDPGFEGAEFDLLEWRTDGTSRWTRDGIPPLAIEIRVTGLDPDDMQLSLKSTNRPDLSVEMTLRQEPDAGQVIVERAVMFNTAGDILSVSGVFERVFLSSQSMMQVSMGSAAFKAGLMSMTLDGTHENPFGFYVDVDVQGMPGAQRQAAFEIISNLPEGVVGDAARAELTAFAGDLPRPKGTLEVSVASQRGLGLMQIGMSAYMSFVSVMEENGDDNQLEILLDGLTVDANWTPSAQVAD